MPASTLTPIDLADKSTIVRSGFDVTPAPGPALVLSDGTRLRVRRTEPDDERRLAAFFGRLGARSLYQRFLTPFPRLPRDWFRELATVDHLTRLVLVAEDASGEEPAVRAVAHLEPGPDAATREIAIAVEDGWQGRGLGGALLDLLLAEAERLGVRRFTADVLAENRRMLRLLWRLGDIRRRELSYGVLTLEFERRPAVQGRLA